jgi:hypothetical protein
MAQSQYTYAAVTTTWENYSRRRVRFRRLKTSTRRSFRSGAVSSLKRTWEV